MANILPATIEGECVTLPGIAGNERITIPNVNTTTLNVAGTSNLGGQVNYPNNMYTYTAPTPTVGSAFRWRTTDTTNTTIIGSLANAAVGASVYYSSWLRFFTLGNTETNTNNTEAFAKLWFCLQ